jgi:hypothetical protein
MDQEIIMKNFQKNNRRAAALPLVLTVLVVASLALSFFLKDSELFRKASEANQARQSLELRARSNFNLISTAISNTVNEQIVDSAGDGTPLFHASFCTPISEITCLQPASIMQRLGDEFVDDFENFQFTVSCVGQGSGSSTQPLRCDTLSDDSTFAFPKIVQINFSLRDANDPSVEVRGSSQLSLAPTTLNAYAGLFYRAEEITFGPGRWTGQVGAYLDDPATGTINLRSTEDNPLVFDQLFVTNISADPDRLIWNDSTVNFLKGRQHESTSNIDETIARAAQNALSHSSKTTANVSTLPSDPLIDLGVAGVSSTQVQTNQVKHHAELALGKTEAGDDCETDMEIRTGYEAAFTITTTGLPDVADPASLPAELSVAAIQAAGYTPKDLTVAVGFETYSPDHPYIWRQAIAGDPVGGFTDWGPWIVGLRRTEAPTAATSLSIDERHTVDLTQFDSIDVQSISDVTNPIQVCNRGLSFVSEKAPFRLKSSLGVSDDFETPKDSIHIAFMLKKTTIPGATEYPVVEVTGDTYSMVEEGAGNYLTLRELLSRSVDQDELSFALEAKVFGGGDESVAIDVSQELRRYEDGINPIGKSIFTGGFASAKQPTFRQMNNTTNAVAAGFSAVDMRFAGGNAPGVNTAILSQLTPSVLSFKLSVVDLSNYLSELGISWVGADEFDPATQLVEYDVDFGTGGSGGMVFVGSSGTSVAPAAAGGGTVFEGGGVGLGGP